MRTLNKNLKKRPIELICFYLLVSFESFCVNGSLTDTEIYSTISFIHKYNRMKAWNHHSIGQLLKDHVIEMFVTIMEFKQT